MISNITQISQSNEIINGNIDRPYLKYTVGILGPLIVLFGSNVNKRMIEKGYNNSFLGNIILGIAPTGFLSTVPDLLATCNYDNRFIKWIRKLLGIIENTPQKIADIYDRPNLKTAFEILEIYNKENINKEWIPKIALKKNKIKEKIKYKNNEIEIEIYEKSEIQEIEVNEYIFIAWYINYCGDDILKKKYKSIKTNMKPYKKPITYINWICILFIIILQLILILAFILPIYFKNSSFHKLI